MIDILSGDGVNQSYKTIAQVESLDEAESVINAMGCLLFERDEEFKDCADAILNNGEVLTIQPKWFNIVDAELIVKNLDV